MPGVPHAVFMAQQRPVIDKTCKKCGQRSFRDYCKSCFQSNLKPCSVCKTKLTNYDRCSDCKKLKRNCTMCNNPSERSLCERCFQETSIRCKKCEAWTTHDSGFCGTCRTNYQYEKTHCANCDGPKSNPKHKFCRPCFEELSFPCKTGCGRFVFEEDVKCERCEDLGESVLCLLCLQFNERSETSSYCNKCLCTSCQRPKEDTEDKYCARCTKSHNGEVCMNCRVEIRTGGGVCVPCQRLLLFKCTLCKTSVSFPESICKACKAYTSAKKRSK